MAQVGIVKTLEGGVFYAKDSSGNIRELSIGDSISENEVVYGDSSNQTSAKVEMELSGNDIIVLNQAQQQLIDSSLNQVTFGNEEVIFSKGDINTTFENADLSAWNNTTDDVSDDMETAAGDPTQQETQAGEEEPTEEGRVTARFSARDGSSTDVRSDLRDTSFGGGNTEEPQEQIPTELLNPVGTTTTPTTPTIPVDTRVPASTITLTGSEVFEGQDITITATVDNAPQTDLVITLNNGEKITIKAGETSGSTTFTNPNTEDVYKDSSTETYTIVGTDGGNYKDLDIADKSTVTIVDTIDATNYTLTSTASGDEENASITYTVTFTNPTTQAETVSFNVGTETITIDVPANSTGASKTVSYADAEKDYYQDVTNVPAPTDLSSTNNSEFEGLNPVNNATAKSFADHNDQTDYTLTSTASGDEENASITYTVTFTNPTTQAETVSFNVGTETITIDVPANSTGASKTVSYADAEKDYYQDVTNVPAPTDLSSTNNSEFEGLNPVNNATAKSFADHNDQTDYTLTSTASGDEENASITYTVTFTNPTTQAETVSFNVGTETITIDVPANSTGASKTVSYADAEKDYYQDVTNVPAPTDLSSTNNSEFEGLNPVNNATAKSFADHNDQTDYTLTSTASGDEENASITYTVTFTNPTTQAETVSFNVGTETITIDVPANSTGASKTVSYADAEKDYYQDVTNVPAPTDLSSTNNSEFEGLNPVNNATAKSFADHNDQTDYTLTSTASGDEENASITYTVTFTNPTTQAETVSFNVGTETITIDVPANSTGASKTVSYADAEKDYYQDVTNVPAPTDLSSTNNSEFEGLNPVNNATAKSFADHNDQTDYTLTSTASGDEENASITYTVTFTNPTTQAETVSFNVGTETITIDVPANSTGASKTVSYADAEKDYYQDVTNVPAPTDLSSTNNSEFEGLNPVNNATAKSFADHNDQTDYTLTSTASGDEENASITYTVTFTNPTTQAETVSFNVGTETITIDVPANSTGASKTVSYADAEKDYYQDVTNVPAPTDLSSTNNSEFEGLNPVNNATAKSFADHNDQTDYTLTSTASGDEENASITYTVTFTNPTTQAETVSFNVGTETITIDVPANSTGASKTVSYADAEKDYYQDVTNVPAPTDLSSTNNSEFEGLNPVNNATAKSFADHNDQTDYTLTSTASGDEENASITYTVTFTNPTTQAETVSFNVGTETITIDVPANSTGASKTVSYADAEKDYYQDVTNVPAPTDLSSTNNSEFEGLNPVNNATAKSFADHNDQTDYTLTSTASGDEENASITYTVTFTNPTTQAETVSFNVGTETITIDVPANSTGASKTVSYADAEKDYYQDVTNVPAPTDLSSTNNSEFEGLNPVNNATAKSFADHNDQTDYTLTSTASGDEENASITYTVTFTNPTTQAETVSFNVGTETITIDVPANSTGASKTVSYADAEKDYYQDVTNVPAPTDLSSTNNSEFEGLNPVNNATAKSFADHNDQTDYTLTSTASGDEENASITYTVTFTNPTTQAETVSFNVGTETITIDVPANSTGASKTVSYADAEKDYYQDVTNVPAPTDLSSTNNSEFEGLNPVNNATAKSFADHNDQTDYTLTSTASGDEENASITYTVTFTNPTTQAETVSFNVGTETITIDVPANSTGASKTVSYADAEKDYYQDVTNVPAPTDLSSTNNSEFEGLNPVNNATAKSFADHNDQTDYTLTSTASGDEENASITYTVTFTNPTTQAETVSFNVGTETITIDVPANSTGASKTVSYADAEKDYYQDVTNVPAPTDLSSTNNSEFEGLNPVNNATAKSFADHNDQTDYTLTSTASGDEENASITYTVTFTNPTTQAETVSFNVGTETITIDVPANSTGASKTVSYADAEKDYYQDVTNVPAPTDLSSTNNSEFEGLNPVNNATAKSFADHNDQTDYTLTSTASGDEENASITYTVTFTNPTTQAETVSFNVGTETITIDVPANSTGASKTVSYADAEKDYYQDVTNVPAPTDLSSTNNSEFEGLNPVNNATAKSFADHNDQTDYTLTSTASGDEENASITYTVTFTNPTTQAETVSFNVGTETITIDVPANSTGASKTVSYADAEKDYYQDVTNVPAPTDLSSTNNSEFEGLNPVNNATAKSFADHNDQTDYTLTSTASGDEENASITYTVTFTNPTTQAETVSFNVGTETITIDVPANSTGASKTVSYADAEKDYYQDVTNVPAPTDLSSTNNSEFEGLNPVNNATAKSFADHNDQTDYTLTSTASGDEENASITYTVTFTNPTTQAETVSFNVGTETITIDVPANSTGASKTVSYADAEKDYYQDVTNVPAPTDLSSTNNSEFEGLNPVNNATAKSFADHNDQTDYTLTSTASGDEENASITYTVTFTNPTTQAETVSFNVGTETITIDVPANSTGASKTVSYADAEKDYYQDVTNVPAPTDLSSTNNSEFEGLNPVNNATAKSFADHNDQTDYTLTSTASGDEENASITYTVTFTNPTTQAETVSFNVGTETITIDVPANSTGASKTVSYADAEKDYYQDVTNVPAPTDLSSTNNSEFEGLNPVNNATAKSFADHNDQTDYTLTSTASGDEENASITYTVTFTNPTTQAETVSFNVGTETITIDVPANSTGASKTVSYADAEKDYYQDVTNVPAPTDLSSTNNSEFEGLNPVNNATAKSFADHNDQTDYTLTSTASGDEENASITYTVTFTNPTTQAETVSFNVGTETITIDVPANSTGASKTVSYADAEKDYYQDVTNVPAPTDLSSTNNSEFEGLNPVNNATAKSFADHNDQTDYTLTSTASGDEENASITYTVTFTNPTTQAETVSFNVGTETITIDVPANSTGASKTVSYADAEKDYYQDVTNVPAPTDLSSTNNSEFEGLNPVNNATAKSFADHNDQTDYTLTSTASGDEENASITYTVTFTNPTTQAETVSFNVGTETITIDVPANSTGASKTVSYADAEKDYYQDVTNVPAPTDLSSTNNSEFEGLNPVNNATAKSFADHNDQTDYTLTSTASGDEENASITYTVTFTNPTTQAETVSFNVGTETITIDVPANSTGASKTVSYADAEKDYYQDVTNVPAPTDLSSTNNSEFEGLNPVNNATAKSFADHNDQTDYTLTSTASGDEENASITYTVTFTNPTTQAETVSFNVGTETITIDVPANSTGASKTVSYADAEKDYYQDVTNVPAPTDLSSTNNSEFEGLNPVNNATAKSFADHNDQTDYTLTSTASGDEENASITYTVTFTNPTTQAETVSFNVGTETITIDVPANSTGASKTVSYADAEKDYYQDVTNVPAPTDLSSTNNSEFEGLNPVNNATAKSFADHNDQTDYTLTSTASGDEENASITYTVTFTNPTTQAETVSFNVGTETITIDVPANSTGASKTVSYADAEKDYYQDVTNVPAPTDLSSTNNSEFEGLNPVNNATAKSFADHNDQTDYTLTSTASGDEENASITYTVTFTNPTTQAETVSFNVGTETITIDVPANSTGASKTVSYADAEKDYYQDVTNVPAPTDLSSTNNSEFEGLNPVNNATAKSFADHNDQTDYTLTSTASGDEENASITYTVTFTNPTTQAETVSFNVGTETITIDVPANSTGASKTVSYADAEKDYYQDVTNVPAPTDLSSTNNSEFEGLNPVNNATAKSFADHNDQTDYTLTSTASGDEENASITYTVTFTNPTTQAETVSFNVGTETITIDVPANSTGASKTVSYADAEKDYYQDVTNVPAPTDLSSTNNSEFEGLNPVNNATAKSFADHNDQTDYTLTSTASGDEENASITYTVTFTNPTTQAETVSFNVGTETITIDVPANSTGASKTVSYADAEKDYYQDVTNVPAPTDLSSTNNSEFEGLNPVNNATAKSFADHNDQTDYTLTSTASGDEENASITYTVTFTNPTTQAETVSFNVGTETITIDVPANSTGASKTVSYADAEKDYYQDVTNVPAPTDLSSTNNSEFEGLNPVNNATAKSFADHNDQTDYTLTSTASGDEENASITYTVTFTNPTTQAETVSFNVGTETITIDVPANSTGASKTVSYKDAVKDYYQDVTNVPAPTDLSSTNNSKFEGLNPVNNATAKSFTDHNDPTTVKIEAAKVTDKVITKDNFENNAGFTVKAKDPYGNDAKISTHTG
ncbi:beta strand repeat-containing protein [Aliarcobacter butzleri]|uniref:beta strand repeat-containing protein n=1 Tax=Aliarcobacter butzleri TaxID=28197 RepID=UPI003AFA3D42